MALFCNDENDEKILMKLDKVLREIQQMRIDMDDRFVKEAERADKKLEGRLNNMVNTVVNAVRSVV